MTSRICDMLGIEFPLLAFSHCRDVVAAVSRAGGFGVLGATIHTPDTIREELDWIDRHVEGRPYGIDVLVPENLATKGEGTVTTRSLQDRIPVEHRAFAEALLSSAGVKPRSASERPGDRPQPFDPDNALRTLEAAFQHPIKLIANALGVPPPEMIAMGRSHGVPVAALAGAKEHAVRLARAGVDIIVAQGTEAGGHCGEVSTLVLVPEIIKALRGVADVPVLAAGGIMTGEQMAAMMAIGADGAWTGSVWLATHESECSPVFREKMIEASIRDAVRVRSRTGKPARQLRSTWTDAWEKGADSPGALPMPFMSLISEQALLAVDSAAEAGNASARDMVTYFVGQGVGLIDDVRGAGQVVQDFKEGYIGAVERMNALAPDDAVKRDWGFAGLVSHAISKPTIAAVNGMALGGGLEIMLACDLAVAVEDALFGLPEPKRGLFAAAGGVFRLPEQLPRKIAMEMILTGEPITAARALELGLVNAVAPAGRLLDAAFALAERIAVNAPLSVRASKRMAQGIAGGKVAREESAWAQNRVEARIVFASEDSREGPSAFAQKRAPVWQSR